MSAVQHFEQQADQLSEQHRREFFIPFSEPLMAETGFDMGPLVPFSLDYEPVCVVVTDAGEHIVQLRDQTATPNAA